MTSQNEISVHCILPQLLVTLLPPYATVRVRTSNPRQVSRVAPTLNLLKDAIQIALPRRDYGAMDSVLARQAEGPGLIPATSNCFSLLSGIRW